VGALKDVFKKNFGWTPARLFKEPGFYNCNDVSHDAVELRDDDMTLRDAGFSGSSNSMLVIEERPLAAPVQASVGVLGPQAAAEFDLKNSSLRGRAIKAPSVRASAAFSLFYSTTTCSQDSLTVEPDTTVGALKDVFKKNFGWTPARLFKEPGFYNCNDVSHDAVELRDDDMTLRDAGFSGSSNSMLVVVQ